jgi:uncharacterized CHY-type Zn-finger protein
MDLNVKYTLSGKSFNQFNQEIIVCGICGGPTTMQGTKRCDSCYELESRIKRHPSLTRKILKMIAEEKALSAKNAQNKSKF